MRRRRQASFRARIGGGSAPLLRMTALMDIFTTLLLFLLKSFVVEGTSGTVTAGVVLPSSLAREATWEAPIIAVTPEHILFEDQAVPVKTALAGADLRVAPLYESLTALHRANADQPGFEPRVVVQGDRSIEFRLLQRVIYTSQLAGFTQVSLAVVQDETALAKLGAVTR